MDNNVYVNYDQNNIEDYLGSAKRAINNVLELVDDGKGLHSKSMSVMMMAFGGAIGSADMLAGINEELHKVDAEKTRKYLGRISRCGYSIASSCTTH